MSNQTKGLFSVPKNDYVPRPAENQRHLRFGTPGVAANDPEPISNFGHVPENDEVNPRQECKEREDHKPGPQSANLASALGKYATAIAQERLENPSDLTSSQNLPPVQQHSDEKELLNRLNKEAQTRQHVENYEMERTMKGGLSANVKSAADKLENDLKAQHK
ncbi:16503_t:CDS:2 [Gigaspora rosea]|nr:16503_t:CDS:2 [Gigaspora rosea]